MQQGQEDNVLESSVVKTVRNLKKTKTNSEEDVLVSRNGSTSSNRRNTAEQSYASNTDGNLNGTVGSSLSGTSSKKTKLVVKMGTGSIADNLAGTPSNKEEEKVGVFNRLTMSKAQAQAIKESKKAKKEVEVNFFDNIYSQTILELVDSILNKSKTIKTLMDDISRGYVYKHTVNDVHFNICFKLLLSQLYKEGEINSEFKNMNKPTFLKLEKFIVEKIQAKVSMDNVEVEIKEHYKEIDRINEKRIKQIQRNLAG